MANKRGQLNCTENVKNTGYGSCFEDWKLIKGALLYDRPRSFTQEEIDDLEATLIADAKADNKSSRMFPLHDFRAATDNTEDLVIQTYDYGSKVPVREGDNDWGFQFVDGGNCLLQSARSHNGKRYVLFYDSEWKILGMNKVGLYTTIPLQFFYASPWKLATGSTAAGYFVRFVFESKYANQLRDFVKAAFDPAELTGLQDVDMILNSWDQDTGIANVTLQTSCGSVNLYDELSSVLADEALYEAHDDDGEEITISSVAAVPGDKTFDFTLDVNDFPDDGIITLKGKAPSVFAAENVNGYEIGQVELPVEGS